MTLRASTVFGSAAGLLALAAWFWFGYWSPMRFDVGLLIDVMVGAAILGLTAYVSRRLGFRGKLWFMGLMTLACLGTFCFDRSIGFRFVTFFFLSLLTTASSLWETQNPNRLSLTESVRYLRSMLRNEPSPDEVQLLASIRADKRLSKL
jgi:hypothetical protein